MGEDIRTLLDELQRIKLCVADAKADIECGLMETALIYLDEALDLRPKGTTHDEINRPGELPDSHDESGWDVD
jgi:hypothetical protein